jgi:signal transduction histidine kinase
LLLKEDQPPADVREKAGRIIDETDRVTAQLNEFINFSRPREVHHGTTKFNAVAIEVARALCYDIEDKKITVEVQSEPLFIQADEPMFRQAMFNLVLNAIQSVPAGGKICLVGRKSGNSEAVIEVQDNGHGVPAEHEDDIFKPYFTTREKGTGLGLAVVKQIVLAHHWEIRYVPNQPSGAIFRISQIKLATAKSS